MRRYIERSSDAGPSSLRLFCLGCIIATRGYDFREGQVVDVGAAYWITYTIFRTFRIDGFF